MLAQRIRVRALLAACLAAALATSACIQAAPVSLPGVGGSRGEAGGNAVAALKGLPTPIGNALPAAAAATATAVPGTPSPQSATSPGGRATVAVRRGPIADEVLLLGRVSGQDETRLAFTASGKIGTIHVKPGQAVQAGQVLAELASGTLAKDIAALRNKVEVEAVRLGEAQAQAQARQEGAVADAQDRLRRAQLELDRVKAGPAVADVKMAEAAVVNARAAAKKAEADLARTKAGPTPVEIRAAESDLATAKTNQALAQADLDRLMKGADPYELRAAQRAVDLAESTLKAAQAGGSNVTAAEKDAAVTSAQLALQDAQDRLAKLKEKPSQPVLDAATSKVEAAKAAVATAQDRLATLRKGPDPAAVEAAQAAAESAQLTLAGAEARLTDLKSHPTPEELSDAQSKVTAAQAALAAAQAGAGSSGGSTSADLLALQKGLEQDRSQLAALEKELEATRLKAPSPGVVASVEWQPGDTVEPGQTVVVLAAAGDPIVRATIPTSSAGLALATGLDARVQLDGADSATLPASVLGVQDNPDGGRAVLVKLAWPNGAPSYGTGAQVRITLQEKTDALVVPVRAVRSAGDRRYVEYLEGDAVKTAEVTLGISNGKEVEIVSGVQQGQRLLLGSS